MNVIVGKTYRLTKKIGEGSFGKIFAAEHVEQMHVKQMHVEQPVEADTYAVKLILKENNQALWQNEINIYERLQGVKYIPSLYAAGSEGKYNYIVMDLLEQNLEQLRTSYGSAMNLSVILHLGCQMITLLETIHSKGILHRDIKPENFLIKTPRHNGISELYLIDFGLARCYITENTNTHIPMKTNETIIGTLRYMSVSVQQGFTASRKDDLESLGYILLYLQQGELPWQKTGEMSIAIKQTFGWGYANQVVGEFILFIQYCRGLNFSAKPNYDYLRNLLMNLQKAL